MLESVSLLLRPWGLAFLLPQVIVSGLLLAGLASFHRAPLDAAAAPLVRALGGQEAAHYPEFFVALFAIFETLSTVANAFLSSIGWVAFLAATPELFQDEPVDARGAWRAARAAIARTWAVTVPVAATGVGSAVVFEALSHGTMGESPRIASLAGLAVFGITVLVQTLAAYALPAIALGDLPAGSAWKRSFGLATRNLGLTAGFLLAPRVVEIPFRHVIAELPNWWETVDPETVVPIIGGWALASAAATLVSLGALARFHLHRYGVHEALP
jgi:hypothetical protein